MSPEFPCQNKLICWCLKKSKKVSWRGEAISRPAELYAEAEVAAPLMQAALCSWRSTCRPKRGGKKRSKYVQSVKRRQNVDPVILRHHFMPFDKINGNLEQIIYNMLPIESGHAESFA